MSPYSPIALAVAVAHGLRQLGGGTWSMRGRHARSAVMAVQLGALRAAPRRATWSLAGLRARVVRSLTDLFARDGDHPSAATEARRREADLVEARLEAERWRGRAEASERQVAELEARLAEAELVAMGLRSRVVCLHGKLATTSATVRYQTMTLALEHQGHARADGPSRDGEASAP